MSLSGFYTLTGGTFWRAMFPENHSVLRKDLAIVPTNLGQRVEGSDTETQKLNLLKHNA